MIKGQLVEIELVKADKREYLIKNNFGITIGRIYILDYQKNSKFCLLRMRIYKSGSEGNSILRDTLNCFLSTLFNQMEILKVSILTTEDVETVIFLNSGFELEGIVKSSLIRDNMQEDELLLGLEAENFQNNSRINILRLKGKNVEMKVLTPEDSQGISEYYIRNKSYLQAFEPSRTESFYTLEGQRSMIMESYKQYLNGTSVNMGIYRSGNIIGKIQLSNIVMGVFRSAFAGYSIDQEEQGKGYMKEALNLIVKYAFEEMELHRIEASTLMDNFKSQGVLKGCGFKMLGLNEKYLFINGQWRDHYTFYLCSQNI